MNNKGHGAPNVSGCLIEVIKAVLIMSVIAFGLSEVAERYLGLGFFPSILFGTATTVFGLYCLDEFSKWRKTRGK